MVDRVAISKYVCYTTLGAAALLGAGLLAGRRVTLGSGAMAFAISALAMGALIQRHSRAAPSVRLPGDVFPLLLRELGPADYAAVALTCRPWNEGVKKALAGSTELGTVALLSKLSVPFWPEMPGWEWRGDCIAHLRHDAKGVETNFGRLCQEGLSRDSVIAALKQHPLLRERLLAARRGLFLYKCLLVHGRSEAQGLRVWFKLDQTNEELMVLDFFGDCCHCFKSSGREYLGPSSAQDERWLSFLLKKEDFDDDHREYLGRLDSNACDSARRAASAARAWGGLRLYSFQNTSFSSEEWEGNRAQLAAEILDKMWLDSEPLANTLDAAGSQPREA
jgi:hypothetical protein